MNVRPQQSSVNGEFRFPPLGAVATSTLTTKHGDVRLYAWQPIAGKEPIALSTTELDLSRPVLVRIHSECITSEIFGSLHCDCLDQKEAALRLIVDSGNGIFIYDRQEGRGVGLQSKLDAYALQRTGVDTYDANVMLGLPPDARQYALSAAILRYFGVERIHLLTNNPEKLGQLENCGFLSIVRQPLIIAANGVNDNYLDAKRQKFKHLQ